MNSYFKRLANRLAGRLSVNLDGGTTAVQQGLIAGGIALAILFTLILLSRAFH
jgi:hypothetical protein